jgi:hypothetical protein
MPIESADIDLMIEQLEQNDDYLTDWERRFVDSIENNLSRGYNLTTRQIQTIEKIWRERVPERDQEELCF